MAAIGVVLELSDLSWLVDCVLLGCLYPSLYIQGGWGYKKDNWVGYNIISIMTLSLLIYFTYISMGIIIYALGSMLHSSWIFWIVGRVVANPSLGLSSPCGVVPWILILISSPWVLGMWVDGRWSRSSLSMVNLLSTQFKNQVLWHENAECILPSSLNRGTV
jgi:hypothetical protein